MKHWNTPVLEVIESLGTSAREGLAPDEAARRLAKTGPNAYRQAKGESLASQVLRQFKDVSNIILLVAAPSAPSRHSRTSTAPRAWCCASAPA